MKTLRTARISSIVGVYLAFGKHGYPNPFDEMHVVHSHADNFPFRSAKELHENQRRTHARIL